MTKIPLCALLILMAQASMSMAFVSRIRSIVYSNNAGWTSSCMDLSPHYTPIFDCERPRILLPSHRRSRNYHRFMTITGLSRLHASSIDRESDLSAPTTDLKELASRIDKNNSSRGMAGRRNQETSKPSPRPRYQLGVGKNAPVVVSTDMSDTSYNSTAVEQKEDDIISAAMNWNVPQPATRKQEQRQRYDMGVGKHAPINTKLDGGNNNNGGGSAGAEYGMRTTMRLLPYRGEESARLTKAVWDEGHFVDDSSMLLLDGSELPSTQQQMQHQQQQEQQQQQQNAITDYRQIDLSIPSSVYSLGSSSSSTNSSQVAVDLVWDLMRQEAQAEAAREPLLVSFLYSTILNHPTLESALSFHLANRLSSPAMLSTQIMSLIQEALDADPDYRRSLRADILAVRDRDPACNCLPDVFLYFKGFHALQTYRAAHYLWKSGRRVLAHYLQSQVSQHFQIDIHPNATLGSGIMLDHGTGIVIGETAHVGHNCSVLHHVTLGGSGKKGNDRHPKIGNGVLLGAGASVLGNIHIGDGCQVGAGTLVIDDLPPRSVAVGVPAKIIGRFVDVTAQPSIGMNQLGSKEAEKDIYMFGMDGI